MIYSDPQEFYKSLTPGMSILAIDYGAKKIGVAISDPGLSVAMPLSLIEGSDLAKRNEEISKIIFSRKPCAIVLGMPFDSKGNKGPQTEIIEKFAEILFANFSLPIYLQDERSSSREADSILKFMGMKRKERNRKDDPVAASLILETALRAISGFKGDRPNF